VTERKTLNPWLIFALICVPIFIGSVDLTSIVVVLPQATLDLLGPKGLNKADQALWAVTAYLLAYTISLAVVGRLSDVLPRKRIFIGCLAIFIAGSVWAGLATDLPLKLLKTLPIWPDPDVLPLISLVIGRVIQAIGAGASVSVGMALVSDIFPPEHRAEPISLIGAVDSLGWVIGNLYAGLMLQILPSWRWLFLINAGVALGALGLTLLALRNVPTNKAAGRYDVRGAVVFASALIFLTVGIEELNHPALGITLLVLSVLTTIGLIVLEFRTRDALFDMKFIRQREVRAALLTNFVVGFSLILMVAGVPLVINLRSLFLRGEGLLTGALRAGVMLSALTLPLIVAVVVGESRYRRIGAAVPVSIGLLLAIIGFMAANLWTYTAPNYVIALPLALVGVGLGLTIGPLSLVVVDSAEASVRGLASSLVLMMRLLGMTFGTPLAAALTLQLANDWASQRVETMGSFRDIARSMLIPPMATDALAHVLISGAVMCGIALLVLYLPRVRRAVAAGLGPRAALRGAFALLTVVLIVGLLAYGDSITTPTILRNPIARQLPPNVEFYAALNIQQVFLQNTRRPLDAVVNILNFNAPPAAVSTSTESPINGIVRFLFNTKKWSDTSFKAFCADDQPPSEWQGCFAAGLLSWIGPQAAFALLPRTRNDFDYVFAFQATNRNNAIQFATNLATALGEPEPVATGPTTRLLTINGNTPDARALAITDAYVLIGTPKAVQYTLNHGDVSLADQEDYQAVTAELPSDAFGTFYIRSTSFQADLQPALTSVFHNALLTNILNLASQLSLTRTSTAPLLIGMALRVDEQTLSLNAVADFPFSLEKLDAQPIPAETLNQIPDAAGLWAATNVNIAGLARDVSIQDVLAAISRSSGSTDLRRLINSSAFQTIAGGFGKSFQKILTFARGDLTVTLLSNPANVALIMPLRDDARTAVDGLKSQLTLLTLSGAIKLKSDSQQDGTEIVTVSGDALTNTIQYTLTADNRLIIGLGDGLIRMLGNTTKSGSSAKIGLLWPKFDRFFYVFLNQPDAAATLTIGGQIRHQSLYVDAILSTH
jgi:MFS family permease